MKKVRFPLLLTALVLSVCSLRAQDLIYRINPVQTIEGKVIEVGETSVRYTRADTRADVTFNIPTQYIQKIIFEDGKELVYNDVVDVSGDRKNAIKLGLLSPAWNATTLYYERSLKAGQSIEFGAGLIGFGFGDFYDNDSGFLLRAGYKFITRPEYYQSRFRYAHLLKGSYIKPELTFVNYSFDNEYYNWDSSGPLVSVGKKNVSLLNFSVVGGKQWVFQNSLLLDIYAGIGTSVGKNENWDDWNYAFVGEKITFTCGFKVGFLF